MNDLSRITFDSNVMGGKPCIRGMRVTVSSVVQMISAGISFDEILKAYPYLERQDLEQAELFARDSIHILWVPRDKHDHEAAERAIAAGYPAVEPVLPELLEWMQDTNWPVAQTLEPFLASIGTPLIPHLESILRTNDHIWKAWVISRIIEPSKNLAQHFRNTLESISKQDSQDEDDEWLAETAQSVLNKYGFR
jgi:uncharacterized protein (DUF433 family)